MVNGHKMQSHFLWTKSTLKLTHCQITVALEMKGEGIFPNLVSTLLKFPVMIWPHPGILCPNVDE